MNNTNNDTCEIRQLVIEAAKSYKTYAPKALLDDTNTNKLFKPKIDSKRAFLQNFARIELMRQDQLAIGTETFNYTEAELQGFQDVIAADIYEYVQELKALRNTVPEGQLSLT